ERAAFGDQLLTAAVGVQRLAVEVIDPGALDVAGARRLVLLAMVRVPALLPVGQRLLGLAQRLLAHAVVLAQRLQTRFGVGDRGLQFLKARLIAADMAADLRQRMPGFLARLVQALGHLALVRDLLLQPRQSAADLVAFGLGPGQDAGSLVAAHAPGFQLALGLALFGDQLLQPRLLLRQALAQRLQLAVQGAELQRLPLRVANLALGLDRGVLLGLPGLPG